MAIKRVIKPRLKPTEEVSETSLTSTLEEVQEVITERPMKAKSLHEVVDRNRLFKMIYSGVENKKYFDVLYNLGIRDFLISYHYVQEKNFDTEYYRSLGTKFFIDSGAYTYMNNEKYANQPKEYWEKYIVKYLDWARKNKDIIFAIANLDLDMVFDTETIREWNKKYFEPFMLETGILVCFIWHTNSGEEGWEYYTKRYPYTGFSWVSDTDGLTLDFNFGKRMLDVARKNNSVCHGMGMTRTSLLTKIPFYTSDSTTWLVGLQYGEVNYWTGRKMTRLKKEKWKGEYLADLVALGCNKEKLMEEDTEELIKANVIAFLQAQEYIDQRLKPRMYWLQPVATKRNLNDKETMFDLFPSEEWMSEELMTDLDMYCGNLNINPDISDDDKATHVYNITLFCRHEDYDLTDTLMEALDDYHEEYINRVVGTDEEKIADLEEFAWNVVCGNDDTLLLLGVKEEAKERDNYIEEEEFEELEVSEDEYVQLVEQTGLKLLPEQSAPEIDELDKEIFDQTGFAVVRDSKGKFVKGQKLIKKPKNVYSDKYPKLACNTCYAAQTCPQFKEGYVCAFNKMFKRFDCRKSEDILEAMQGMVNLNMERMQRTAIFEMLDGGMPDSTLTGMIDQNMRLLMNMKQVYESNQEVVRQVRTIGADGTIQETTQVNSNAGSGVMEALMKNLMKKSEEAPDLDINEVIEVNPEDLEKAKP